MTSRARHPLAEDYLARLRQAAARLPRTQRDELVAELAAHVDAGALEAHTDAAMRNMLDALGDPDDIVAEAMPPARGRTGPTGRLAFGLGMAAFVSILLGLMIATIPLGFGAAVTGVRARRHLRRIEGGTGLATSGLVLGILTGALPIVAMVTIIATRTTSHEEPGITTEATVTVPAPTTMLPG